jgi:hypothetical protein
VIDFAEALFRTKCLRSVVDFTPDHEREESENQYLSSGEADG